MSTEISTSTERSRASVRRWYANHREEYAELRRKRYRSNPELRAKARKDAARYRRERQEGLRVTRTLTRMVQGQPIEVYSSGYVADRLKITAQVLRGWEARGWIPAPIFAGEKHRLYTARQIGLLRLLADALRIRSKGKRRVTDTAVLDEVITVIHKTWKVVDHGNQNRKEARRGRGRG